MRDLSYKSFIETTEQIIDQRGAWYHRVHHNGQDIYAKRWRAERKNVVVTDAMKLLEQMTARQLMR